MTLGILIDLKKSFILVYSVIALYGFAMFSGGMKLAIGSYILLTLIFLMTNFASMARSPGKFLGFVVLIPFLGIYLTEIATKFLGRWLFFYNKFDFLSFFTSGRNLRAEIFFNELLPNMSALQHLFGHGWGLSSLLGKQTSVFEMIFSTFISHTESLSVLRYLYGCHCLKVFVWLWSNFDS